MNELQKSMNGIKASEKLKGDTLRYLEEQGIRDVKKITSTNLNSYILHLEKNKFSTATISRNIASLKAFYSYLYKWYSFLVAKKK